ncbi:16958_t:CDS:2, partial [Dentiscutata erythropus]
MTKKLHISFALLITTITIDTKGFSFWLIENSKLHVYFLITTNKGILHSVYASPIAIPSSPTFEFGCA